MNKSTDYTTRRQFILDLIRDVLFELYNLIIAFKYLFDNQIKFTKTNRRFKNIAANDYCFVLGNGPSLKLQDVRLLRGHTVFAVNRLHLDERYRELQPKYHVIVDDKLANGEWDLALLSDIRRVNPEVTFILNANWLNTADFVSLDKKFNIIWVDMRRKITRFSFLNKFDISSLCLGSNVVEDAIICAHYMGYRTIYVTGIDGDGFLDIINNRDSHSYGKNDEDVLKLQSPTGVRESISSVADWLLCWEYLVKLLESQGTKLVNLTGRGIFKMMESRDFYETIKNLQGKESDENID